MCGIRFPQDGRGALFGRALREIQSVVALTATGKKYATGANLPAVLRDITEQHVTAGRNNALQ